MTLNAIVSQLRDAGIADARFEAASLISHFAGISFASVLADRGRDYTSLGLAAAVEKRASRYPLQYIIGKWEFFGLEFEVNEACLIPRPDTEVIVEAALRELEHTKDSGTVLDLCTGSGCIAAAVLSSRKDVQAVAVELVPETAEVARKNLARLGLADRCTVLEADVTLPETVSLLRRYAPFDVIVSNPPYVTRDEMESLEPELSFEPRVALTDEGDGMSILNSILELYPPLLKNGGALILEHGAAQPMNGEAILDYSGKRRGEIFRLR